MAGPRRGKREKGDAKGARILLVEARFYDDIADALLAGAMKALTTAQAEVERISGFARNSRRDCHRARRRAEEAPPL
jgi:hypothetical protein